MNAELELQVVGDAGNSPQIVYEALIDWLHAQAISNFSESTWNIGGQEQASISIYLASMPDAEALGQRLHLHFGRQLLMTARLLPEDTWRYSWRENFSQLTTQRFVVQIQTQATQLPDSSESKHVITIAPGSAFGRGDHATTEAMLLLLEKHLPDPDQDADFLDVGTGSGVLSIAAQRLGYQRIVATEIDDDALTEARTNFVRNQVSAAAMNRSDVAGLGCFATVASNILSGALYDLLPQLATCVAPHGLLLLSGFIEKEAEIFSNQLQMIGFQETDRVNVRGWIGLAARRAK